MSLKGKIAVVTGASRGIGRGVALQLGAAGAKVYITGRDPKNRKVDPKFPTLEQTAKDVTERGGQGIPVYVDHSDDDQVKKLFEKVAKENGGKLDILVNSAYSGGDSTAFLEFKKFWESDPAEIWDVANKVGLRGHYITSAYAARLFVKHDQGGLIVNISSAAAKQYLFNVALGVGKAAVDRLTADMAIELQPHKVAVVSLWPGITKTEFLQKVFDEDKFPPEMAPIFKMGYQTAETQEYAGKGIVALANDPKVLEKTGKFVTTAGLGNEYGFKDIDGREITFDHKIIENIEKL